MVTGGSLVDLVVCHEIIMAYLAIRVNIESSLERWLEVSYI